MDLYCLDHLCSFWTLGRMNNRITEKSNFEKGPAINLNPNSAIELVRTLSPWCLDLRKEKIHNKKF